MDAIRIKVKMTDAERIVAILSSLLRLGVTNASCVLITHGHWHVLQQGRWVRLTDALDAQRKLA